MVIIGAPLNNSTTGKVQVWKNVSGTWQQVGSDFDGDAASDGSGFSVAINNSGSIISIGSAASNIVRNYNLTTTWTGATNDVWQTASNWSGNTVPA